MVYLCWELAFPMAANRPSTLVAVFAEEGTARSWCEARAAELAKGSGLIAESMTGDSWDVTDPKRRQYALGFNATAFGPVDSF